MLLIRIKPKCFSLWNVLSKEERTRYLEATIDFRFELSVFFFRCKCAWDTEKFLWWISTVQSPTVINPPLTKRKKETEHTGYKNKWSETLSCSSESQWPFKKKKNRTAKENDDEPGSTLEHTQIVRRCVIITVYGGRCKSTLEAQIIF